MPPLYNTLPFLSFCYAKTTRLANTSGWALIVHPSVFHPRYFISSGRFAKFVSSLDFSGKRVIDIGILAIAAARAGSKNVFATDINPNAALSVAENARMNGVNSYVTAACMDLLSGFVPRPEPRSVRIRRACEKKFPKLRKRLDGARTILVLEDNDVQTTNVDRVADAYLPVASVTRCA